MAEEAQFSERGDAASDTGRDDGADATPRLAPGTLLRATYRIIGRLGQGGMGEVYEASHTRLPGRYAIKVLRGDLAQDLEATLRFRREAEITSRLRHPGIVNVVDFDATDEGEPYIVMEFLEGEDMAKLLGRNEPRPRRWIADVVSQIAAALGAAHALGVVHRDLKPQNVFLVPLGPESHRVKVVDFGISKMHAASQRLTRETTLLGTPPYMSPEQAIGRADDVDARADQFALATLAYELVTGRRPFDGENVMALFYQIVNVDPPPMGTWVPAVPPAAEVVLRKGLAKSRDARFPTIEAFAAAFAEAVTAPVAGTDARASGGKPSPLPKRRALWPAAGALVGLGMAAAVWWFWPAERAPRSDAQSQKTAEAVPVVASPAVPAVVSPPVPPALTALGETPLSKADNAHASNADVNANATNANASRRSRVDKGHSRAGKKRPAAQAPAAERPSVGSGGTILRDL